MSDIAKCSGAGCNDRNKCWRFVMPADKWQWYSEFKPEGYRCEHFKPLPSRKENTK